MGPLAYAAEYIPEDEPLLAARANAAELGGTEPVHPAVGATLRFLACAVGARTAVEIGTGCGSSGIWLLRGMRPGSTLTSVDIEPEYQRMARKAFTQAGFAQNQCRLILGRALDVLPRLSDSAYDVVFCDADVRDYPDYLIDALRLLRPGGVVAFNNVLPTGTLRDDPDVFDGTTGVAHQVRGDDRLVPVLVPLGNGLLAAVKRGEAAGLADHGLQGVTKLSRLVRRQLNNQAPAAFKRDAHDDAAPLFGDLKRTVARPRLHRRHSPIPFLPVPCAAPLRGTAPAVTSRATIPGARGGTGQPQSFLSVALLSRVPKQNGNDRSCSPSGEAALGDLEAGAVAAAFGDTVSVVHGGVARIAGALRQGAAV